VKQTILLAATVSLALASSGVFAAPVTRTLTTDGAWTWFNDPRGLIDDGKLYTGWINSGGFLSFARHDLASGVTATVPLYNGQFFQDDDHDNPAILRNSATSFTAFYAPHGGASVRWQDVTINPTSGAMTAGTVNTLGAWSFGGSSGWTYANPYRLSDDNGAAKTYLFARAPNFNPSYRVRNDATGAWGAAQPLVLNSGQRPYVKYHSNNVDRIGFAFTDGHPRNVQNNIYYAYLQDGAYFRVDGTKIKDMSAGALTLAEMQGSAGTVYNHTGNPAGDDSWIWDVASDDQGRPVVAYATFLSDTVHEYHWSRWEDGQWHDRRLVRAGPSIALSGETHYSAGIALDPTDPETVYLSYRNAGTWNLQQWKLNDDGESWATQLIANGFGPTDENVRPFVPQNRPADDEMVLWLRGHYDYWNNTVGAGYDMSVMLWQSNPPTGGAAGSVPEPSFVAFSLIGALVVSTRRCRRQ
jgi:hypothetical protein